MMALFIVLWLMGSSSKVKKAVAGYFNDPKGTGGLLGTTMSGTGDTVQPFSTKELEKLKERLEAEIKSQGAGKALQADRDHDHSRGPAHRIDRGQGRHLL
jgi:chemotaxis protein MotB